MKRTTALFLTLALLLALAACRAAPEEADTSLDSDRGFIHYGATEGACATEDTVYYMTRLGGQLVHYYEKASGVGGVLCGKPECGHSAAYDSECNAFVGGAGSLCVYNNRLYWISSKSIYSMALDGSDHRLERSVGSGVYSNHHGVNSAVIHRGYAYIWVLNYKVRDGQEIGFIELSAVPLEPDGETRQIFSWELDTFAVSRSPFVTMQAYGDELYIFTNIAGNDSGAADGDIDFYDFKIQRYDAVTQELTTLYHDGETQLHYTVELWAMDDGIVFMGIDESGRHLFRFDFESGGITPLFDLGTGFVRIAEDLAVSCTYDSKCTNPTNPWGLTLAPQDIERSGELKVVIRNFAGDILVDGAYPLNGLYSMPEFLGNDDTYAYFLDSALFNAFDGDTTYSSLLGVALDGSGMEVLCTEEEYFPHEGTNRHTTSTTTLDDGTTVVVVDGKTITVTTPDGKTVTMTVEELLENGYQT